MKSQRQEKKEEVITLTCSNGGDEVEYKCNSNTLVSEVFRFFMELRFGSDLSKESMEKYCIVVSKNMNSILDLNTSVAKAGLVDDDVVICMYNTNNIFDC